MSALQLADTWLAGVEPAMRVLAGDQAVIGANRMALLSASRESQPANKMIANISVWPLAIQVRGHSLDFSHYHHLPTLLRNFQDPYRSLPVGDDWPQAGIATAASTNGTAAQTIRDPQRNHQRSPVH